MKHRLVVLVAVAATAFAGGAVAPATAHVDVTPVASAKACSSGWTHGVIARSHKCLRSGQFCARRHDSHYHRYGYHCHRYDASVSRYRLSR